MRRYFICVFNFILILGIVKLQALTAHQENVTRGLKDNLVVLKSGDFEPYDAQNLGSKPYTILYYSASWCPPCKAFTPKLVEFYSKKKHEDLFEVILFSLDKSERQMKQYMQSFKMKWPALRFDQRFNISWMKQYAPKSIPRIIILDANGIPILDNVGMGSSSGQIIKPELILEQFGELLAGSKK